MERPVFGKTPTTLTDTTAAQSVQPEHQDPVERHRQLTQEYNRLKENRVRRMLLLQQATEEDERCRQEAAAYGASTPEELEAYLLARRERETQELNELESKLREEARRQQEVEENLAAIDK